MRAAFPPRVARSLLQGAGGARPRRHLALPFPPTESACRPTIIRNPPDRLDLRKRRYCLTCWEAYRLVRHHHRQGSDTWDRRTRPQAYPDTRLRAPSTPLRWRPDGTVGFVSRRPQADRLSTSDGTTCGGTSTAHPHRIRPSEAPIENQGEQTKGNGPRGSTHGNCCTEGVV